MCRIDMEMKNITTTITQVVVNVILSVESEMFKKHHTMKGILNEQKMNLVLIKSYKTYFNNLFRTIRLKNNDYIVNLFDKMSDKYKHGRICLLNMIYNETLKTSHKIKRNKLNISSYANFLGSVEYEIYRRIDIKLHGQNHICYGGNIFECDSDECLFC